MNAFLIISRTKPLGFTWSTQQEDEQKKGHAEKHPETKTQTDPHRWRLPPSIYGKALKKQFEKHFHYK